MRRVLVDSDCGVDDSLALSFMARSTGCVLAGVTTTWGNCTAEEAAANARFVLSLATSDDVPVVAGSMPASSWQRGSAHGRDGLGDTEQPRKPWSGPVGAPEKIVQFARENAGTAELLCIGPLTNLATALTLEPNLPQQLRHVVVMAGHVDKKNDWLQTVGDTNTRHDPIAAQLVAESELAITWVGIDVTRQVLLDEGDFGTDVLGRTLRRIHDSYGAQRGAAYGYAPQVEWKVPAHDGVTAACLVDDLTARLTTFSGRMAVQGDSSGHVLRYAGPGHHRIADGIDASSVRAMLRSSLRWG